jgi:integrase
MARKAKLGKHMRWTPSGNISLQFTVDGERVSQRAILPDEPASYSTVAKAQEGVKHVLEHLSLEVDRRATVRGFYTRWSDVDDKQWGAYGTECPNRSEHAIYTYASALRPFIESYGERAIATLNDADIRAYTQSAVYAPSHMTRIHTFLEDAETAGLRAGANPAAKYARNAEAFLRGARERNEVNPPKLPEIDELLAHLSNSAYPRSLYGWFLCGSRTGMRGGELDGMQFEYVDFDACTYQIDWQLHARTGVLDRPKHNSMRPVFLDDDVMAEIERMRERHVSADWIWTNTEGNPWRHTARNKWWRKTVAEQTAVSIVGDATMYNATRHHWASWAVNEGGMTPYQASILYGHSDGGKLISDTYAKPDEKAAIEAVKRANANRPASMTNRRRAA